MMWDRFERWQADWYRKARERNIAHVIHEHRKPGGWRELSFLIALVLGLGWAAFLFGWLPRLPRGFARFLADRPVSMGIWIALFVVFAIAIAALLSKGWRFIGRWSSLLLLFGVLALVGQYLKISLLGPSEEVATAAATAEVPPPPSTGAGEPAIEALAARWRADIVTTGATGAPGVVPPFLGVREIGGNIEVTNHHAEAVCVQLARVAVAADGTREHCPVGPPVCREIASGTSLRFLQYRSSPPICAQSPLEFRVGEASRAGPAWWTSTALGEFAGDR